MADTPKKGIPEISVSQANKEVTHNEGLRRIESWSQALDKDLTAPPGGESDGDTYIVAQGATGTWAGHDAEIAVYQSTAYIFTTPIQGERIYVTDEGEHYEFVDISNQWTLVTEAYDVKVGISGLPGDGAEVHREILVRAVEFEVDFSGSQADSGTNSAGAVDFDVNVNGTLIGNVNFNGATITFSTDSIADLTLVAGDVITIDAPTPQDGSLADVSITLKGKTPAHW